MERKAVSAIILIFALVGMSYAALEAKPGLAWSNGGFSADPSNPNYGTHDWIAQHALDWLPSGEKEYVTNNLALYLYGTELPDNGGAPDGIGDVALHHVYYWANESVQDDASAVRAQTEYNNAINYMKSGDVAMAVKTLGIMSHYIVDVGVFGHVMATGTDWGPEIHHADYEDYVNAKTNNYTAEFNTYLIFDGALDNVSAYDAALTLAFNTTFGDNGNYNCTWMDQNYDWSDPAFKNRCGESLNIAANFVADVLHTFYMKFIHDIAVVETARSKSVVGQGFSLEVNVTVKNEGEFPQTLNVTVYANTTSITTFNFNPIYSLAVEYGDVLWNTSGFALGNYTLQAVADTVAGETDTADNNFTVGWVVVAMVGDITGLNGWPDGKVDMRDVGYVARRFMCNPGDPLWDPNTDINGDGKIDMRDIGTVARHFGEHQLLARAGVES